ncbi:MAG: flippase [Candidatus Pacearchaeota archaeon]
MKKNKVLEKDKLDNSLKLLIKSSFVVFIGLILSKIIGYAYRIIIARYFGPEIYGFFSLALSITVLFVSIAGFGLNDGLLRFIPLLRAKNKIEDIKYLFKKTIKFYWISGLVTSILLIILSDFISLTIFHNIDLSIFIKIMGSTIILHLFTGTFLVIFRGYEKIGWYSFVYNILMNISRFGILVLFVLIGLKSESNIVAWSFVIGSLITLIGAYIISRYIVPQIFEKYDKKDYSKLSKEFIHYSWPVMFYGIISLIFYWIDTFSLGYYKSAIEVGIYNAAVPIALLLGFIPEIFMQLFFPLINKEYSQKNYKLIEQLSKQVTKWIFISILPIFILIFFFPGAVLNILFGVEYLPAVTALRLLLVGTFVSAVFIVSNNLISMLGKSKLILKNIIAAAIINLILNSILVPSPNIFGFNNTNGLIGAALSTLISLVFFNVLFLIQTKKYLSFLPFRRKMITITLISLIPTFILFYLRSMIPLNVFSMATIAILFILLYCILILISNSLDENDWMIIKGVWKKIFIRKKEKQFKFN